MKSKGYTLAEVLITLAVIGVIAAVVAPLINKYRPDTTKIMYLKTYDAVVESIDFLAKSNDFYPLILKNDDGTLYDFSNNPLYNTSVVKLSDATFGGKNKLCATLAYVLSSNKSAECKPDYLEQDSVDTNWSSNKSFDSRNGAEFIVTTNRDDEGTIYKTDIYFDVNGTKGNNCLYSDNCKEPDRFKLSVSAKGQVYPTDPIGNAYLKNRHSVRKIDLEAIENPIESWDVLNNKIVSKFQNP